MTRSLFIDGAAGTTGLQIRERLEGRGEFTLVTLSDADRKDPARRAEALNSVDFVILCLPDDAAREAVKLIENPSTRVIDASSAHRVAEGWTYGLPELDPGQQEAIAAARLVTNPGCWPSGFLALVRPLVRVGIIPSSWPLIYSGATGYSGGGKSMIAEFEDDSAPNYTDTAYRAYGLGLAHKHLPEMQKYARIEHVPVFLPAVARTLRGMLGEVALPLAAMPRRPSLAAIEGALQDAYRDSPVIQVAPSEGISLLPIEIDEGSDRMTLRVFGNAETGQARLIATYDNLGKGASGAAVQNLNIMAGLDPIAGLNL